MVKALILLASISLFGCAEPNCKIVKGSTRRVGTVTSFDIAVSGRYGSYTSGIVHTEKSTYVLDRYYSTKDLRRIERGQEIYTLESTCSDDGYLVFAPAGWAPQDQNLDKAIFEIDKKNWFELED